MAEVSEDCNLQVVAGLLHRHQACQAGLMITTDQYEAADGLEAGLPDIHLQEGLAAPDLRFYAEQRKLSAAALAGIKAWLGHGSPAAVYYKLIREAVGHAFAARSPLRPERFVHLREAVVEDRLWRAIAPAEVQDAVLGLSCIKDLPLGTPDLMQPGEAHDSSPRCKNSELQGFWPSPDSDVDCSELLPGSLTNAQMLNPSFCA